MAARCYLCQHQEKLAEEFKSGDTDPVGECDKCSVLACDKHAERGTNALFICYLYIPSQVASVGPSQALELWPQITSVVLATSSTPAITFQGASLIEELLLARER